MNTDTLTRIGIVSYAVSALAFCHELMREILGVGLYRSSWVVHEFTELATLFGFVIGGVLIWASHRKMRSRNAEVENLLRAAQGEFSAMVQAQFERWGLSQAEQDIALLTAKGLTVAEIAEVRATSLGTVKSQNNAIYKKAGVSNRTQLVVALIDELLVNPDTSEPELKAS
ncbi:helix-turn-helix transcriptional regulator [Celeribacter litoreus]|uniref:helix-turn-helix transcriptional regulator n=1 Tax=Celeribacter litoreus TaxID=2876714 RepID=UPI001CC9D0A4|nr:LuxR C-terminal-related transcriptional regulator [Celeribacter litoreus]MCA0044062.1 LuxR C-terminal-related transcriptional regulator [Celeribacter litoreus]